MIQKGRILKGVGGFYYVKSGEKLYESKASALFRIRSLTPIVGDYVEFEINDDGTAYIKDIKDRSNLFIRPPVSNVDEIFIIVSIKNPNLNYQLIDRMILLSRYNGVEPIIIINKSDLDPEETEKVKSDYEKAGFKVHSSSLYDEESYEKIRKFISKKTTVFMGVSGVGKSTIISHLIDKDLEVGEISEKTSRGKHTTRHVELLEYDEDTYIVDTPGFSSLGLDFVEDVYDLEAHYYEFHELGRCKFSDCLHINEPKCIVKEGKEKDLIQDFRYNNYVSFYDEIRNRRK